MRKKFSSAIMLMFFVLLTSPKVEAADPLNNPPDINDIEWFVEEGIAYGDSGLNFGYTNNTQYPIVDIEMYFRQKENLTDDDLAVFDSLKEESIWDDEDIKDLYILGYNRKLADVGETVTDSLCVFNSTYTYVETIDQYNVMEPDTMDIAYIGADNKIYGTSYDFHTQQYSSYGEPKDAYQWIDTEMSNKIPKPEALIVSIGANEDNTFSFTANGFSLEDRDKYVQQCKDLGYINDANEGEVSYDASNSDGYSITTYYNQQDEEFYVKVSSDEQAPSPESVETSAAEKVTEASAQAEVSDDQIRPEFKEAMDSYEAFFDEYVEFMKKYSDSGSPLTMALDYANYLSKYTETMEKLDELGEEEMTSAELGYYTEVMGRITQKLASVVTE